MGPLMESPRVNDEELLSFNSVTLGADTDNRSLGDCTESAPTHTDDADTDISLFDSKREVSNALEHLRKESLDIFNRLHSIAEDARFIEQVHRAYPTIPLLPNLRCGAWYSDPKIARDTPAYFKSTDGHFSNWSFNLRRANLHLLPIIAAYNGMALVDSTRSGKRIPDALSKTVPIWCAVINRAITRRFPDSMMSGWDLSLYTPPGAVSGQEHDQIEQRIDGWADALFNSSFTLPKLAYPLRPLWITPATTNFPLIEDQAFLPVVCISASKQVTTGTERRTVGFSYVQGSGDDHELWSMGLTPGLFWQHKADLLAASRDRLSAMIPSLVSGDRFSGNRMLPTPILKIEGRILICAISDLANSQIDQNENNTTSILLGPEDAVLQNTSSNTSQVLQMHIPDGKKGQIQFLQDVLPRSMSYIESRLTAGYTVCIACSTGQDISVGIALSALQRFFDEEGNFVAGGMPADKKSIRTRLEWIISSRPLANPSRATLKRVNEFLLTPASFRGSSAS